MKVLLILFLVLFHHPLYALDHFSVNLAEVEQLRTTPFSVDEINSKIDELIKDAGVRTISLHGVDLVGENEVLVNAFERLFTRTGHFNPRDVLQEQVHFGAPISEDCKKVICVLERVWGKKKGVKILWAFLRYGFNLSEYAYEDSDTATLAEVDDILQTLRLLPKASSYIFHKNIPFVPYRNITGKKAEPGKGVLADSSIFYYEVLRQKNSAARIRAFYHELGHLHLARASEKVRRRWRDFALTCHVSRYGATSSGEDFAETYTMYRFNEKGLKELCPEKYSFMREILRQTGDSEKLVDSKPQPGLKGTHFIFPFKTLQMKGQ